MGFLRWIYDKLALIGAAVLGLIVVLAFVSIGSKLSARLATRSSVKSPAPRDTSAPAKRATLPIGREEARAKRIALPAPRRLYIDTFGKTELRTQNAWVERHGPREYLLVTRDAYFLTGGKQSGERLALRLADGRAAAVERHEIEGGLPVAFVRFCAPPAESLRAVFVPAESLVYLRSAECP